ncbi:cytochrome P450 4C1-like [Zophobas morio]|uniref:cytochrome P450 4C1-like n=1 Tax=Zophobas morio TaxID=2755281 RepID=UPI003082DBEC
MAFWNYIPCVIFIITLLLWRKIWLLYYAWKIPGAFSLPLVTTVQILCAKKDTAFEILCRSLDAYRPIGKAWIGSQLYIATMRPTDVEKILTKCLNKSPFYDNLNDVIKNTLVTSKVDVWKKHRKIINPSFNLKILNSFHDVFVKYSREIVEFLNDGEGREQVGLISVLWEQTFDASLVLLLLLNTILTETLTNVRPHVIKERHNAIRAIVKIEKILIQRFYKFWLLIGFIWKLSNLHKVHQSACQTFRAIFEKIVTEAYKAHESENRNDETIRNDPFLPHLIKLNQSKQITREDILEETCFMVIAASETTALTVNAVLMILGINPDIQEKVYQELVSVLPLIEKDPTLEEIRRLDYLKRVIKETLRLCPAVPFILRYADEDINCDPYVFPAGSNMYIPIIHLHKDPDVWPEPEKFDPDRFLPDEVAKRHRCSYIPFSFGARNCIGVKYAMMSITVILATILRRFKVHTPDLKSLKDIEWEYFVVLKPKYSRFVFEKRRF